MFLVDTGIDLDYLQRCSDEEGENQQEEGKESDLDDSEDSGTFGKLDPSEGKSDDKDLEDGKHTF